MTLKRMFGEASLNAIRDVACDGGVDDAGFSDFQRRHLQSVFPSFAYDRCTTSLIETDGQTRTMNVEAILLGFEASLDEVMASYMAAVEHDRLSMIVYANPGRLFLHSDVFEGRLETYPIFELHCRKYDIHKVYSIGFSLIAADEFVIAFDYMAGEHNTGWYGIDPVDLEYASFPFALAWLLRKKRIGRREFNQHLTALAGLTRRRLEKLRRFINRKPGEDLERQAVSLNLKLKGYDDPLYDMRDTILTRFDEDVEALKEAGVLRLEALEPYCFLLSMMKDQTRPIVIPDGVTMTPFYHARMGTPT